MPNTPSYKINIQSKPYLTGPQHHGLQNLATDNTVVESPREEQDMHSLLSNEQQDMISYFLDACCHNPKMQGKGFNYYIYYINNTQARGSNKHPR